MLSLRTAAAIAASWFATIVLAGDTTNTQFYSTPTVNPTGVRASTYSGCYATSVPLIDHGGYTYQTSGNCQRICYTLQNNVMGLGNGTDCWCGDMLPPANAKVSDDKCNTPCAGFGTDTCKSIARYYSNCIWAILTILIQAEVPPYGRSS
jgi:cell wall integrity and stress response component